MQYIHETRMKVRDYECDIQGIVNNANYQHYLEHARHEFLRSRGLSFTQMHREGIDPVVAAITVRFKTPLKGMDEFLVKTAVTHEGIRYIFHQDIYRASDMKLSVQAQVDIVCLTDGKLTDSHILDPLI